MKPSLRLVCSVDVEEEGLFGGQYARRGVSVGNVAFMRDLLPLVGEEQVPFTFFCTHSVVSEASACGHLDALRAAGRVEIGAHLHHWNTPPVYEMPSSGGVYESAGDVPQELMAAKMRALVAAVRDYAGSGVQSFRMGRWDIHRRHWPLLLECGIKVDASVRPLHCGRAGSAAPDHFDAPCTPYWLCGGSTPLLEVPLTSVPLTPAWVRFLTALGLKHRVQHWGALIVQPVYHPLWLMQAITRSMVARGVDTISLTWHSSELMPGGAPHIPDAAAARALGQRIFSYIRWARETFCVQCCTVSDIYESWGAAGTGNAVGAPAGDWFL